MWTIVTLVVSLIPVGTNIVESQTPRSVAAADLDCSLGQLVQAMNIYLTAVQP